MVQHVGMVKLQLRLVMMIMVILILRFTPQLQSICTNSAVSRSNEKYYSQCKRRQQSQLNGRYSSW